MIGAISANAARLHFGWETVVITVAYALGAAIPMLAIAALGQRVTGRIRGARSGSYDEPSASSSPQPRFAILFNADQKLQTWFPNYTHALQGIERSSAADKELAKLQGRGQGAVHGPAERGRRRPQGLRQRARLRRDLRLAEHASR